MSELLVLGLKFAFLGLLWVFVLFTGNVIRTDLFGRRVRAEAAPSPRTTRRERREHEHRAASPSRLRITTGKQAGLTMTLGESLTIGRASDCQLILDDDYVSTHHARITRSPHGYQVEDLGSTNGTFLNNERLSQPRPYTPSDTVRIGQTQLVVEA
ncbi:MAG: FHA domain-containing protein [Propioniciclava sp.]